MIYSKPPPFYKRGGLIKGQASLGKQFIPHGSLPAYYHLLMGNLNSPSSNLLYPQLSK